jgi:outer membrane lipoprotein-sorting protein
VNRDEVGQSRYTQVLFFKRHFRLAVVLAAGMPFGLTGCVKTTRLVQKTLPPEMYRSASVEILKKEVSDRDDAIKTFNASVLITASTGGGRTGQVTTYTSFRGYIFVRQPSDLRVIMQVPVLGSRALDMVSDGKIFTLVHASSKGDVWMHGTDSVSKPSKNALENLRPDVFFDSMLVPGVAGDEFVAVTESKRIVAVADKKREAMEEPDYDLAVMKQKDGKVFQTLRVLHINRVNMLPYQQDIYNDAGQVVTTALYDDYKDHGGIQFPTKIIIERPLDELSLKVEITHLVLNETLEDDQFELQPPDGVVVQKVE